MTVAKKNHKAGAAGSRGLLLTMDIGNSNLVFGLWEEEALIGDWRIRTRRDLTADELGLAIGGMITQSGIRWADISSLIISSVVPPMRPALERFAARYLGFEPLFVEPNQTFMPVKYDQPRDVGADRVVGAIAAYNRFKTSLIVVDFGTATTFDCISAQGEFLGGAIAPGLRLSAEALFQKASRLPKIEMFQRPARVVATNTIDSMNSGLIFGYAGMVDGLVRRAKLEMGGRPKVVATGGLASLIAAESEQIEEVLPELALEGLRLIHHWRQAGV